MSIKSAKLFLEQLKYNEELWSLHKNAKSSAERHIIIKNAGFRFSDDELRKAIDNLIKRFTEGKYKSVFSINRKNNN
jgi:predicted ribosomally synthesized peptide with nif11-like leader